MPPEILVMGENQDYYVLNTAREYLVRMTSELGRWERQELLSMLGQKDTALPANRFGDYGGQKPIEASSGKIVDGLEKVFKQATDYAAAHNAAHVLIQNLAIGEGKVNFNITLDAQLLLEPTP